MNRLLFKFLWKGVDKVTRLSTINDYRKGGLRMIDLDSQIKALTLGCMRRIITRSNNGTWKSYIQYILRRNHF